MARISRIQRRLVIPAGDRTGRLRGYATRAERYQKQRRLQVLTCRLAHVEARLEQGRVSVCRGGGALARAHHHLSAVKITEAEWQDRWHAARLFLTADGEKDKAWGNETIRFHPDEHWVELKLPAALAHLSNRPHGRYRLSCQVAFSHRGEEVAAQAATGAVRYDISFAPDRSRWYLDASWKLPTGELETLEDLRRGRVLGVDLNAGHLATMVLDASGNPVGRPGVVPLALAGLDATTRDGHLRAAITGLIALARASGCRAVVIENLDFNSARESGREYVSRRRSRGARGRSFRALVADIPTARLRDRLVQMAANAGLAVIAVDPAYTSKWGAEHWLGGLQKMDPVTSSHHAAALVIGRRGLGQRARRGEGCDSSPPVDGQKRATNSAGWPTPAAAGLAEQHREPRSHPARGQPQLRRKTQPATWRSRDDQKAQDRSGPPTGRDSLPLGV